MTLTPYVIRPLAREDVAFVGDVLAVGEGYALTDAMSEGLQDMRRKVAAYVAHPRKLGHVAVSGERVVGVLLGEVRDRRRDVFADHSVIGELPVELFPESGEFFEVFDLWVAPERRRQGIATGLKRHLEQVLLERACFAIYTHTERENAHVLRMNEALGYRRVRVGPIWDDVVRVSLLKDLRDQAEE